MATWFSMSNAVVPRRLFLFLCAVGGDGGDDDDKMREAHTRSGCFRFADACPAWIQMDTDRYSTAPGRTQLAGSSPPSCLALP